MFRFFGQDFPTVVSCHLRWQAPAGVKVSFSICHVSVHFHFGSSVEPQSVRLFRGVCRKKEKNWNRLAVLGAARLRRGWTLVYILVKLINDVIPRKMMELHHHILNHKRSTPSRVRLPRACSRSAQAGQRPHYVCASRGSVRTILWPLQSCYYLKTSRFFRQLPRLRATGRRSVGHANQQVLGRGRRCYSESDQSEADNASQKPFWKRLRDSEGSQSCDYQNVP